MKASAATLPGAPLGARQRWLVAGKLALVLVGLGFLLRWALAGLTPAPGAPEAPGLALGGVAAAVLLNQLALFVAALRLRATLAAFHVHISSGQAMAIHLRSLFYFFFVPLVGQELSRYVDVRRIDAAVSGKKLLLLLLLDRGLGLVAALAALAAFAYAVLPTRFWGLVDLGGLAAGTAATLAVGGLALLRRPWRERALDLLRVLHQGSLRLLVPVLLSLAALALVCAAVYVVAATSGWQVGFAQVSFALSASLLGMALPVSAFGATLGEPTGIGVMALLGLSSALAVMLVSLAYVGRLLGAMQGAALELHGGIRGLRQRLQPGTADPTLGNGDE
jgi:hypothetical protein